ncbi:hypothetical protein ILYODFUR_032556, partial [Ilyodon furcidens]
MGAGIVPVQAHSTKREMRSVLQQQQGPPCLKPSQSMICVYTFLLLVLSRGALGSLQAKQTDFGLKVFSQLVADVVDTNLAFSPYGIANIMAMAQLGSNGSTQWALTAAMGFSMQ